MEDEEKVERIREQPRLPTEDDCKIVDFEGPIRDLNIADTFDMYARYDQAYAEAEATNNEPAKAVYALFAKICSIRLQPSDPGNVWHPLYSLADGTRSTVAEDLCSKVTQLLAGIVPRAENPSLRARIADVAWSRNKRDAESAKAAIQAYCVTVNQLLEGSLRTRHGKKPLIPAITPIHRALQVVRLALKAGTRPQSVTDTFDRLYAATRDQGEIGIFVKLAELALEFDLRDAATLAGHLEAAAKAPSPGIYPISVKSAWDLAARLYQRLKDPAARQRCLIGAVEQTLAMRGHCSGAGAEAAWVMDALQQLRHVQGQEVLKEELEADLRKLQKGTLAQMASFEFEIEIGNTPEKIIKYFETLNLSAALRAFAILDNSRDPERLRIQATESGNTSSVMAIASLKIIDREGRSVSGVPGAPLDGEPDERWITHTIDQSESIHRQRTVVACLEPARACIQKKFGLAPHHFEAIVTTCPIIPASQRQIMALGFTRFFEGDFISAAHLLIPQIEPLLRQVLKISGSDPSKRNDDSTEQDLSLSNIYIRFRSELESILTPALAWEIDRLFNTKPGPALRHEVAHGQLGGDDCYHPNVYYANWLIYHVCCLFVLLQWDKLVEPHMAVAC